MDRPAARQRRRYSPGRLAGAPAAWRGNKKNEKRRSFGAAFFAFDGPRPGTNGLGRARLAQVIPMPPFPRKRESRFLRRSRADSLFAVMAPAQCRGGGQRAAGVRRTFEALRAIRRVGA